MKAPFKVLFSNDTSNVLTCVSPYHKKGEPFRPEMLEASVDETAGTAVEVHMLQPGVGVVPFWKSRQYPYEQHVRWMRDTYGLEPDRNSYARYMLDGGDLVQVFVDRCRRRTLTPFISLRLNDSHGKENVDALAEGAISEIPDFAYHCINRFYKEHDEYRIGSDLQDWNARVLNWAVPEVRRWMFGFVSELCENYDLDGFELDFMRQYSFFRLDETSKEQRTRIMTDFVKDVRTVLDRTSKPGRHRWLCVRVPAHLPTHDALGIDLRRFVDAGVDVVNLSYSYYTQQQGDLAAIRKMIPQASVYVEMCHCTRIGAFLAETGYDGFAFRRTTPAQYYTTAHLAYSRGLDGISTFNFVYYREHGVGDRGPFHEPPFEVFRHLGDPAWLARQPQHYFISDAFGSEPPMKNRLLPKRFEAGQGAEFALDLAPPQRGWKSPGRFRIQGEGDLGTSRWQAELNGEQLAGTEDRSEPYENPYPPMLGMPEQHRAWIVPPRILRDGLNTINVTMTAGNAPVKLVFVDLAIR